MRMRMNEWVSEWVSEWMSDWVNEWVSEWVNEWRGVNETENENEERKGVHFLFCSVLFCSRDRYWGVYRLAAHLGSAFVIYLGLFWTALRHLSLPFVDPPNKTTPLLRRVVETLSNNRSARLFWIATLGIGLLTFTTAMSGAFVAGLDAGPPFSRISLLSLILLSLSHTYNKYIINYSLVRIV
jgi:hypothetical protein